MAKDAGTVGGWAYREEEEERNKILRISVDLRRFLDGRRREGESDQALLWRLIKPTRETVEENPRVHQLRAYLRDPTLRASSQLTERYLAVLSFLYNQDPALFLRRILRIRK